MTGGIGDEKLSGRSGISFDIINESENFPILEIFFVDRFGLYRMRIGQMMTVFEIMIQGGIVVDLFPDFVNVSPKNHLQIMGRYVDVVS